MRKTINYNEICKADNLFLCQNMRKIGTKKKIEEAIYRTYNLYPESLAGTADET